MTKKSHTIHIQGFSLVEIIVACAIIAVTAVSLLNVSEKGLELSNRALRQSESTMLLEEGAEAVRSIRDASWSNISSLTVGTTYYLAYSTNTNTWSLITTPNTTDIFTRTVVVSSVNRDTNDDIASSGGTLDSRTKKVTITVTFPDSPIDTVSKSLSLYIADIFT